MKGVWSSKKKWPMFMLKGEVSERRATGMYSTILVFSPVFINSDLITGYLGNLAEKVILY